MSCICRAHVSSVHPSLVCVQYALIVAGRRFCANKSDRFDMNGFARQVSAGSLVPLPLDEMMTSSKYPRIMQPRSPPWLTISISLLERLIGYAVMIATSGEMQ